MSHTCVEYKILTGKLPQWREGSKVVGDGPSYYVAGANSLTIGKYLEQSGDMKWTVPLINPEPPHRIGATCWYQEVEGRPCVFLFGGTTPDALRSRAPNPPGGNNKVLQECYKTLVKDLQKRGVTMKAALKMYCCDVEKAIWRGVALKPNPQPVSRQYPVSLRISNQTSFMAFGRSLPENLKLDDAWIFDATRARVDKELGTELQGCTWKKIAAKGGPIGRLGAAVGTPASSKNDEIYVYGGQVGSPDLRNNTILGDLWTLKVKAEKWSQILFKGCNPGPRRNANFIKASDTELILMGGDDEMHSPHDDYVGSPRSSNTNKEVLVLDVETKVFTKPAIGFLPKQLNCKSIVSDRLPALFVAKHASDSNRNGGCALIDYPKLPRQPNRIFEMHKEASVQDCEKLLLMVRKEVADVEEKMNAAIDGKTRLKSELDKMKNSGLAQDVINARAALRKMREQVALEEDIERLVMASIDDTGNVQGDLDALSSAFQTALASVEATNVSSARVEVAEEAGRSEVLINQYEAEVEVQKKEHAAQIKKLQEVLDLKSDTLYRCVQEQQHGEEKKAQIDELLSKRCSEFLEVNPQEDNTVLLDRPPTTLL